MQAKKRRKLQETAETKAAEAEAKLQKQQQQQEAAAAAAAATAAAQAQAEQQQQQQQQQQQVAEKQSSNELAATAAATAAVEAVSQNTLTPLEPVSTLTAQTSISVGTPDYAAGLTPSTPQAPTILSGTVATAAALQGNIYTYIHTIYIVLYTLSVT